MISLILHFFGKCKNLGGKNSPLNGIIGQISTVSRIKV